MGFLDVLVIEVALGAKDIERAKWRNGSVDESVDPVPCIDYDHADPQVKAKVDKVIDGIIRMANLGEEGTSDHPMLAKEFDLVRAGKVPVARDLSRCGLGLPPVNKRNVVGAGKNAFQNVKAQLQHQTQRLENPEAVLKHFTNTWKIHDQHLEGFQARLRGTTFEYQLEIELLSRERRRNQIIVLSKNLFCVGINLHYHALFI